MAIWPSFGYIAAMSSHSVAEAKNRLSQLIDSALKGAEVVITRHGKPVVELKPVPAPPHAASIESLDRLAKLRASLPRSTVDAGTFVSRMRDEDDDR
jgi:prevent-host-death family protein